MFHGGVFRTLYRCVTDGCLVVYYRPSDGMKCPGCGQVGQAVEKREPR